jgi:hypothetical protein
MHTDERRGIRRTIGHRRRAIAAGIALAAAALVGSLVVAPAVAADPLPAGTYTLSFTDDAASRAAIDAFDVEPSRTYDAVISGFTAKLTSEQASSLDSAPGVLGIVPEKPVVALAETVPPAVGAVGADEPPVRELVGAPELESGPEEMVAEGSPSTASVDPEARPLGWLFRTSQA